MDTRSQIWSATYNLVVQQHLTLFTYTRIHHLVCLRGPVDEVAVLIDAVVDVWWSVDDVPAPTVDFVARIDGAHCVCLDWLRS